MTGGASLADVVLLAMGLELVLLIAAGRAPRAVLLALLPGACLALALCAALNGSGWGLIALPLVLSLPLHLADLRERGWLVRRRRPSGRSRRRIVDPPTWNEEWRST